MTRKSHYGWMALGGILCLFGIVLLCKLRDGNRAMAQNEPSPLPSVKEEPPPLPPIVPSPDVPPPKPTVEVIQPVSATAPVPPPPPAKNETLPPPPGAPGGSDPRPIMIPASATVNAPPPPPAVGVVIPPPATGQPLPPIAPPPEGVPPPSPPVETRIPIDSTRDHPGEPPLAPTPGPVVQYRVVSANETFKTLARKTLGSSERWSDIHKLNPTFRGDAMIPVGTVVRLPGDACVQEDAEALRPLPTLRTRLVSARPRQVLPLTGTFSLTLDENKVLTLPRMIVEQLGNCDTVLLSPGSDKCLWLTNQAHLDRLQAKLDKSPARESDVRGFKRLYYAQTMKVGVKDNRVTITDKLATFASLGTEVVLVGIDDHFEVWDAARWRRYMQTKKASRED